MAYPLGGSDDEAKYFFLEIHYDNPKLKKDAPDFSGVRLYGTKNYRKNEFGVFTVGGSENYAGLIIPPGADKFSVNYGCSADCVDVSWNILKIYLKYLCFYQKKIFEEQEEIKVFSTLPHTHLTGRFLFTLFNPIC